MGLEQSPSLHSICHYLDELLEVNSYTDMALNGLQVESPAGQTVMKIGFAVDCGLSIVQRAAGLGCSLLVVHHGLFWGKSETITGPLARKIQLCMSAGLSIYGSHLPLDGHLSLGNAAQIAQALTLEKISGFAHYGPRTIGVRAEWSEPVQLEVAATRISTVCGTTNPLVLPFGSRSIRTVAIITGSGSSLIGEVANAGIDLLVSGEPKQEVYHRAKELECSAIFAGHYATETFGVKALERVLANHFRVDTVWIDEPTGI